MNNRIVPWMEFIGRFYFSCEISAIKMGERVSGKSTTREKWLLIRLPWERVFFSNKLVFSLIIQVLICVTQSKSICFLLGLKQYLRLKNFKFLNLLLAVSQFPHALFNIILQWKKYFKISVNSVLATISSHNLHNFCFWLTKFCHVQNLRNAINLADGDKKHH